MVQGSKLWLDKRFSLLDTHSDRPWDPFSLFYKGNCPSYQGMKRPEHGDHPPLSSAKVKHEQSFALEE
jgi:hypothetical protein